MTEQDTPPSAAAATAGAAGPAATAATALRAGAEAVAEGLEGQRARWGSGFTRRKFLAGVGMAGVAALGSQLVTTKVAYGAAGHNNGNTLVTVFLRGAADGLRALVPATSALGVDYLRAVRPSLVPADSQLVALPGAGGWAVNPGLAPLLGLWNSGELAFVPAVSVPGIVRSHFEAQQFIERGGSGAFTTGWLDRALQQLGPGTTFRAVAEASALPASMAGNQSKLVMNSLKNFTFPGWDGVAPQSQAAIRALYRGLGGPLGEDVPITLGALHTAGVVRSHSSVANGAVYPKGNFGTALADIAAMLRAEVGLQVAAVDVGGWDTHTNEAHDLDQSLSSAAQTLAAFMTDLGPVRRKRVTVVVMTEFGRRVAMNASGGTDHGHGSVMWLLGGGLTRGVHGRWAQLATARLDQGDVPGWNNAFDVLGELAQKRLGVGGLSAIFPGHHYAPIGVAHAG